MKNKLTKVLCIFFLLMISLAGIIMAADFTPQGDINLRGVYAIKNATNITSGDITSSGNISAVNFNGNLTSNSFNLSEMEKQGDGKIGILDSFINSLIDLRVINSYIRALGFYNQTESNSTYVNVDGDTMSGNLNINANATANWFKGLFNWTTGDSYTSFDGATLTTNETKINETIDARSPILNVNSSNYWDSLGSFNSSELEQEGNGNLGILDSFINGLIDARVIMSYIQALNFYNTTQVDTEIINANTSMANYVNGNFYNKSANIETGYNVSADYVKANVDWTNLTNYPVACPANSYLTQLDDSVTCTEVVDIPNGGSANFTGDLNVSGHLKVGENLNVSGDFEVEGNSNFIGNITANQINKILFVQPGNFSDIQAKINIANGEGGGEVIIPCGNYVSDASITIYDNIKLRGSGYCTLINSSINIQGQSGDKIIKIEGADSSNYIKNIKLSDLRIVGNGYGNAVYGRYISEAIIENLYTENASEYSQIFMYDYGENIIIRNNFLDCKNTSTRGVYIDGNFNNVITAENEIIDCDRGVEYDKLTDEAYLQNVKHSSIIDNIIEGGYEQGIFVEGGEWINIEGNNIRNKGSSGVVGGIDTSGGTQNGINYDPHHIVISNNLIKDMGIGGAIKISRASQIIFDSNIVQNTSSNHINIANANEVTITNNYLKDSTSRGIYLQRSDLNATENIIISNNKIHNATTGILGEANDILNKMQITSNIITNTSSQGIYLRNGTDYVISDNILENTGSAGILVDGPTKVTINQNNVKNSTYCIRLATSNDARIVSNTVEECGDIGFYSESDVSNLTYGFNTLNGQTETILSSETKEIMNSNKIVFSLGEIIDNLVDGWIRITGGLNITENLNVYGNTTINENLTVNKNVEVAGNITGNFHYGEMWFSNETGSITTAIGVQSTWYNVTGFNNTGVQTGQDLNGFTFDSATETFISTVSGKYKIDYSISAGNAGANEEYQFGIAINNVIQNNTISHRKFAATGDVGNAGGSGFIDLINGDIINLQVLDADGTSDIGTHSANLNLMRIGN